MYQGLLLGGEQYMYQHRQGDDNNILWFQRVSRWNTDLLVVLLAFNKSTTSWYWHCSITFVLKPSFSISSYSIHSTQLSDDDPWNDPSLVVMMLLVTASLLSTTAQKTHIVNIVGLPGGQTQSLPTKYAHSFLQWQVINDNRILH